MAEFEYSAIKQDGKKVQGFYDVDTKEEVIAILRSNGYYPVSIKAVQGSKEIKLTPFSKVKSKDISIFARQFYAMLNSGITILTIVDILRKQTTNKKLRKAVAEIHEDLQKGLTFSESMLKQKDTFPDLFINMVMAGENTGNLDIMMEKMADHYEKENKINNKVRSAMIYPIILSVVSIFVVIFLLTVVMPTFVSMFEGSGVPLPGPTKALLAVSYTIRDLWYILVILLLILAFSLKKYKSTDRGRYVLDKLKLRIPVLNNTLKMIMTSRFTRTLALLQTSGISLMESLDLVSNVLGNKVGSEFIGHAQDEIKKGNTLGNVMEGTNLFPPMVSVMVNVGEESGALDDILNKTADFYDEEVESAIEKFTSLLEPIMIIVMAIIIGSIVIAMVLPMFDMINTISY
ncbi:type II secretion system F family protein [Clostridium sp. D2Q-11]|uniref:Type II secretion system F family protein n=1 Tax=Anaeromonas frigoriresistens TaxID=2683708 RepID=A0A942UWR1_9FIRM|nr:type II secretion system F family protein [Anaeromonas frigoriresistens]MBS4540013.1 type II secretion system F family protein [Anaeromonas frigoriresistens]